MVTCFQSLASAVLPKSIENAQSAVAVARADFLNMVPSFLLVG
jgi:hypothetical protein